MARDAVKGGQGRVGGISVQPVLCRASPVSFVKMTTMTTAHLATPTSPLATLWNEFGFRFGLFGPNEVLEKRIQVGQPLVLIEYWILSINLDEFNRDSQEFLIVN